MTTMLVRRTVLPALRPCACQSTTSIVLFRGLFSRAAKNVVHNKGDSSSQNTPKTEIPGSLEEHPAVKKFPKFMRKYAVRFVNAPMSHVTSFLILHEASAVIPLFGLWSLFHYYEFIPPGMPDWLMENGAKFIKVLAERNDWEYLVVADKTSRLILEGAAAYAAVKVLLPVRIAFSLYLMPWFARVAVLPITSRFSKLFAKKEVKKEPTDEEALNQRLSHEVKKKEIDSDPSRPPL
jgi:hypothetical protein